MKKMRRALMVFEFEWKPGTFPNLAPALVMAAIEDACKGVKITKWSMPEMNPQGAEAEAIGAVLLRGKE